MSRTGGCQAGDITAAVTPMPPDPYNSNYLDAGRVVLPAAELSSDTRVPKDDTTTD